MTSYPTTNGLTTNALNVLYNIARVLSAGGDLAQVMSQVLAILEKHAGMNRGMISILKPGNTELAVDVAHGLTEEEKRRGTYRLGEGITGKVVAHGKPMVIPKLSAETEFLDRTGAREKVRKEDLSFLCVPIKAEQATIGALSVDHFALQGENTLDEALRLLETVADLIAQVVRARRREAQKISKLEEENQRLRQSLSDLERHGKPENMIGNSNSMCEVYRQIAQVAGSPTTVCIRGETGTGKELIARAIHQKSSVKKGPFIAVNCAALPESLLESELFGHEKGSFTGATSKRIGRFEAADGGTLFLDEVGEMSLSAQARLLRAIQEKEFQRVGGLESISVNVRLITATNRNLEEDVAQGHFREDLYYRINVFTVALPPLRERGADIMLLADYFAKEYASIHGKNVLRISTPAIDMLSSYHWPGNVRELENVIERAVLVTTSEVIEGHDLPPTLQMKGITQRGKRSGSFETLVAAYEKELITDALKDARGNQTEAAKLLNTTKRVIQYKVKIYEIDYQRFKRDGEN